MIAPKFLAMLVCPVSHAALREATAAELARVNAVVTAGGLHDRGGTVVSAPLVAGLCTVAGDWLYPIRNDLPILLGSAAIPVPPV